MSNYGVGIDIGGTKTRIALLKENIIIKDIIIQTQPHDGGSVLLNRIKDEIKLLIHDKEISLIGIGTAGQISDDGVVLSATNTFKDWVGINVREFFENHFNVSVSVVNDVQAMALGELLNGIDPRYQNVICIALGTGVGGSIIMNQKLIRGTRGLTGEIGHMILYPNGNLCPCGAKGCVEAYLSGTAIEKNYKDRTQQQKSGKDIFSSSEETDQVFVKNYINDLSTLIASLSNMMSPDLFILSGGVAGSLVPHLNSITKNVHSMVLKPNNAIDIKISDLGTDAMVAGSTYLEGIER